MSELGKEIVQKIETAGERFQEIAPANLVWASEKGFAVQHLKNNEYLLKVAKEAPESLQASVANVAAIGLSLNPAEHLAYLIPRNVKENGKYVSKVFLDVSYQGFLRLATDSGAVEWVQARIVYSNDEFQDNGPGERPTHKYNAFAPIEERGTFQGVYCVAKTKTGDFLTHTMSAEKVYDIRGRSEAWKAGKFGPWKTDFEEMAKKACIRQAFKTWPRSYQSTKMAEAVQISNENEGFEPILTAPEVKNFTAGQKEVFDQCIVENDAMGMYVLQRTIPEGVYQNLYHSFEKGQKGKYQKIVDELRENGEIMHRDYIMTIVAAVNDGDALALSEAVGELSDEAISLVMDEVDDTVAAAVRSVRE